MDKSHALINGIIQEYDICFSCSNTVYKLNETEYKYIGQGIIIDVCGIKHFEKGQKYFYREIVKKEKRSSW